MSLHSKRSSSRYRQFKLTATQETSGAVSYRVYAKPLHAAWDEHQLLATGSVQSTAEPIRHTEDVVALLLDLLSELLLPEAHG